MRTTLASLLAAVTISAGVFVAPSAAMAEPAEPNPSESPVSEELQSNQPGEDAAETVEQPTEDTAPPAEEAEPAAPEEDAAPAEEAEATQRLSAVAAAADSWPLGGTGDRSFFSYEDFPVFGDGLDIRVNIGTGNLLLETDVIALEAPGSPAAVTAVYNSLEGWHVGFTTASVVIETNRVQFWDDSRARHIFTRNANGSYTTPSGSKYDLAAQGQGVVATHKESGERLVFSSAGQLQSRTDRNGVGSTFTSDTVTDSLGKTITRSVDSFQVHTFADHSGRSDRVIIRDGKVEQLSLPDRGILIPSYDAQNRVTRIAYGGRTVNFTYDGDRVSSVVQSGGSGFQLTTTLAYSAGQTSVTDPNGNTSRFETDSTGRVTAAIDPLDRRREQTWTPNSDIATTTSATGGASQGLRTTMAYDSRNNLTGVTLPTGAATQAIYAQGVSCAGAQTTHPYLPKCTIDDAGNTESMTYDTAGNLTQRKNTTAGGAAETFNYTYGTACGGKAGQICTATDGRGAITRYTYTDGLLTKVTPPAPLGATTYTYDALNRVASVTNGLGHKTSYTYDAADRITLTTFHDGTTFSYVQEHAGGFPMRENDSKTGTRLTYTVNALGLVTKTVGLGAINDYEYDLTGNLLRHRHQQGGVHTPGEINETLYTYDAANQLTQVQLQGGDCSAANNPGCIRYEYDDDALETARIFPFGARQDTARDDSGRPTRITAKDKNGTVQNDIAYSYVFNGADSGSVRTRTSHKEQGITAGAVTTYGYDSRSRLTSAVEKTGSTTRASWSYGYDKADNRTRQIRSGSTGAAAGTTNYTYNTANQLTGVTGSSGAWTYDAAGNQTRNALTGATATYGDRLQVTAHGGAALQTHGQGNDTVLQFGAQTQHVSLLGTQRHVDGQWIHRNNEGNVVATQAGAVLSYLTTDHLGSTTGLFSAEGTYLGGYSYSPYGEARSTSTNATVVSNTVRYIGQHVEPSTGLYKLGARYYDTALGRFTQMDPSGQERNPYGYAACDPINNLDPTGLSCTKAITDLVFAGVGAAASIVGIVFSAAATIPSAGATTALGVASVLGLGASGYGVISSIASVLSECD